ncbi:MAG TPA: hypothetical protein VGU46_05850 [Acidobacteriaceae bacterium]|nr:hypothetical protein [Acidobacteriaceae bacterium]
MSAYSQNGVASLRSFLVERREDSGTVVGRFSDGNGIDENLNCLIGLNGVWAWFRKADSEGDDGAITISMDGGKEVRVGDTLFLLPQPFQPSIAFILLDPEKNWERNVFASGAAASSQVTGTDGRGHRKIRPIAAASELETNEVLVPEGWDHEHCKLCYKHIYSQTPYYVHAEDKWQHFLCDFCHERFAVTHSVKEVIYPGEESREGEAD